MFKNTSSSLTDKLDACHLSFAICAEYSTDLFYFAVFFFFTAWLGKSRALSFLPLLTMCSFFVLLLKVANIITNFMCHKRKLLPGGLKDH